MGWFFFKFSILFQGQSCAHCLQTQLLSRTGPLSIVYSLETWQTESGCGSLHCSPSVLGELVFLIMRLFAKRLDIKNISDLTTKAL